MTATVVLLPGLACDEQLWAAQGQALRAAGWRVVHSDIHTRHATLEAMADALCDAHADRPLVLIGASMGGMVALHAALRRPQQVAALALVGSSARADTPEMLALREQAVLQFEAGRLEAVLRANAAFALHPRHRGDEAMFGAYLAMVQRAGVPQLVRQNRAAMARPDLRSRLPQIACPTLVLVGEADGLTPPEHAQEIAAAVAGARLQVIEGAGHLPTIETPAQVSALLLAWLAAVVPASPACATTTR